MAPRERPYFVTDQGRRVYLNIRNNYRFLDTDGVGIRCLASNESPPQHTMAALRRLPLDTKNEASLRAREVASILDRPLELQAAELEDDQGCPRDEAANIVDGDDHLDSFAAVHKRRHNVARRSQEPAPLHAPRAQEQVLRGLLERKADSTKKISEALTS